MSETNTAIKPEVIPMGLLPHQAKFVRSKAKVCALIGGLGSGKTFALLAFILQMIAEQPNIPGLICANSYAQVRDVVLEPLFQLFDELQIPYDYNKQDSWLTVRNTTRIKCASLDNVNMLRGLEVGWAAIEELRDCTEYSFNVVLARVRHPDAIKLLIRASTTPNGFDWIHRKFASSDKIEGFEYVHAKSRDNPFLPDGYIESLTQSYDKRTLEQETEGLFVNSSLGRTYHSFDRRLHSFEFETQGLPLKVGSDFNVNPGTSVIAEFRPDGVYVIDEVYLENSNTFDLAKTLKTEFGTDLTVYPDASGKARKSSSTSTDHEILRQAGFKVEPLTSNPHVIDRVNAVNWLFENNMLFIHPRCTHLIADLEQHTQGTNDKMLGHLGDGLGYMCWKYKPLSAPQKPSKQYNSPFLSRRP